MLRYRAWTAAMFFFFYIMFVMTVRPGLLFFSSIPSPLPRGLCTLSLIYYMPYPRPYCTTYAHISTC